MRHIKKVAWGTVVASVCILAWLTNLVLLIRNAALLVLELPGKVLVLLIGFCSITILVGAFYMGDDILEVIGTIAICAVSMALLYYLGSFVWTLVYAFLSLALTVVPLESILNGMSALLYRAIYHYMDCCGADGPTKIDSLHMFGPTDWKIQNIMDCLHVVTEEGLRSPGEVDAKVNEVGAEYSRARAAYQKTMRAQQKMEALDYALKEYEATKELAERIQALPDGPEKAEMQEQYQDVIDRYKNARSVMYGYKVNTLGDIDNFKERYADIQANLPDMQDEFERLKEEYRKFKKVQYHVTLANNAQYCYGPAYDPNEIGPWDEPKPREKSTENTALMKPKIRMRELER